MARNDSIQMQQLLQPDLLNKGDPLGKCHQAWKAEDAFSCPGPSNREAPLKRANDTPQKSRGDSCPGLTSVCLLEELAKIDQCNKDLGPLEWSPKDRVLIDVRSYQMCLCFEIFVSSGRLCGSKDASCPSSGDCFQHNRRNCVLSRHRHMDEKLCEVTVLALEYVVRGFNRKGV